MIPSLDPKAFLTAELERRRADNKRYSLRAFAADLELNPGYLSRVISGQTHLTVGAAKRAAKALELTKVEAKRLIDSAAVSAQLRIVNREAPEMEVSSAPPLAAELDADTYAVISDMHHYAILEATFLDEFKPEPKWIAKRLGITALETEYAIARLLRLGLLKREDGTLKKTNASLTTKDKSFTTPALKKSQRQIMRLARHALDRDPIETRSSTGMTMAIDPAKLPLAKQMIQAFMEQLCEVLESGERREVYQMGVNLFSLTSPSRMAEIAQVTSSSSSSVG